MVPEAMHSSAARLINTRGRVAAHAQRQSRTRKREREEGRELLLFVGSGRIRTTRVPTHVGGGHRRRTVTIASPSVMSHMRARATCVAG
jgi:hypothetical protein